MTAPIDRAALLAQSTLVAESLWAERWGPARDQLLHLLDMLDAGAGPKVALPRYSIVCSIASATRPWFRERVIVEAPTRVLAIVQAEADIRRAFELVDDDTVQVTVLDRLAPAVTV